MGLSKPGRLKIYRKTWLWNNEVRAERKKRLHHIFLDNKTAHNWRSYEAMNAAKRLLLLRKGLIVMIVAKG